MQRQSSTCIQRMLIVHSGKGEAPGAQIAPLCKVMASQGLPACPTAQQHELLLEEGFLEHFSPSLPAFPCVRCETSADSTLL